MTQNSQRLCLFTIVVCALAIYVYPLTLHTPLLDPDEGIHARIAQEMVARGNYLVPTFGGKPFRDKPILFSAAQALSLRTFGNSEGAVRLPGYMFALLGTVTTVLLARRMFNREVALYTALASLTLALPGILAQAPAHDIALVPWTNLLVLSFWEYQQSTDSRHRWRWVAAMSLCIALALLAKGLIGVAVVCSGIVLYTLVSRTLSVRMFSHCLIALFAGALLASPWFLLMEHASPGYLSYYFVERHLLGFVTEGQEHGMEPWYYYIGPVLGGAMPWLTFAILAVVQLRFDKPKLAARPITLLVCWFVGGFLFLSAAHSKLITYSLPIFPPIAILSGVSFRNFFIGELAQPIRRAFIANFRLTAAAGVIGPVIALVVLHKFLGAPSPPAAYGVAIFASILMAAEWFQFERNHGRTGAALGMLWFPLMFVCFITWPVQPLAEQNSQRSLAAMLNASDEMPKQVVLFGQRVGSVLFYLSPEKQAWAETANIREALMTELRNLVPPPDNTLIAITQKELRRTKWSSAIRERSPSRFGTFNVLVGTTDEPHVASKPQGNVQ